ncbi:GerW family sporulation protein [Clostridiisalibacter paucivorans]|uniref:GerW family sporulation protein n=1 Tax=Clostridiisalibacter paucivorans TaxID=408753 RepID=UPI0005503ED4|nr:GerW family sporulation protein [Clostridiisalibacter paucivorans]
MSNHPIEGLMTTTMENLKEMVDVNTIVGDPVQSPDGVVIIPISKVSMGFASGGGQYNGLKTPKISEDDNTDFPFGGGSGAGMSVQPVAFIVVGNDQIKLLSLDNSTNILNNLFELIPKITSNMKKDKKTDTNVTIENQENSN